MIHIALIICFFLILFTYRILSKEIEELKNSFQKFPIDISLIEGMCKDLSEHTQIMIEAFKNNPLSDLEKYEMQKRFLDHRAVKRVDIQEVIKRANDE